jgi:hypothetical protein
LSKTIPHQEPQIALLFSNGAVKSVTAHGVPGGFILEFLLKSGDSAVLYTQRGKHRIFRSMDALFGYLKSIGCVTCQCAFSSWSSKGLL